MSKDFLQCPGYDPLSLPSGPSPSLAPYRVRLARAGLPVGKDGGIVALQAGRDQRGHAVPVDISLGGIGRRRKKDIFTVAGSDYSLLIF